MRRLTKEFANFSRNFPRPSPAVLPFFTPLLGSAGAQAGNDSPSPKELYDRIVSPDAALFDAYNACVAGYQLRVQAAGVRLDTGINTMEKGLHSRPFSARR